MTLLEAFYFEPFLTIGGNDRFVDLQFARPSYTFDYGFKGTMG